MTDDLIKQLMAAGLNKQQATSATAETLVRLFMNEDGKVLIKEAQRQVSEMQSLVNGLRAEYKELLQKISAYQTLSLPSLRPRRSTVKSLMIVQKTWWRSTELCFP
ncbi:MAG: hypothetical protein Q4A51_07315 [Lachnospiraceae bacterium]|nr:hypothetical protein [Lachnospiraceae bacterium]